MAEAKIRLSVDGATASVASLNSVAGGLSGLEGRVKSVAGGLAGLGLSLSVGAVVNYFAAINRGVDALNDLKDATGASIENISALEDVAARTGAGFDVVSTSLIKLNQALNTAKPGSDAELAINAIGLSVKDLKALDPAEAFRQTAIALSQFDDDANKARLTQILFGKSLKDVAPFLKDLAEAGALVATVTTEQAEATERFNKELSSLNKSVTDIARSLAGPLVDALNTVIARFREGSAQGKGFFAIAASRYWENVRGVYGMATPNTGGAEGSLGAPESSNRPTVGDLPDPAAIKARSDAAAKAAAAANKELSEQAKLLAELSGLSGSFAEDWARLNTVYAAGKLSVEGLTVAQAELLGKQPFMKEAAAATAESLKAEQKLRDELTKTMEDYTKASAAGVATAIEAAQKAEDELAQYGLLKSQVQQLTLAHLEQSRELAALAGEDVANIEKRIEAQRRLIAATQGIEAKDIARASAKTAAYEWQKAADQINQSLSDALMDAFMSGKGFGKTFVDSVTSMFKSMVLRPVISAIVTGATGSLGLGGSANATTTGGSLGSLFSSASSLSSLYSLASTGYAGTVGSGVASLFGTTAGNAAIGTYLTGSASSAAAAAQAAAVAGGAAETAATAAAGLGSSLGTLAAAAPYIAAFAAAGYLIDKYVMAESTPHSGGGSQYSATGGLLTTDMLAGATITPGYWNAEGALVDPTISYASGAAPNTDFAGGFTGVQGARTEPTVEMTTALVKGIVSILDTTAVKFGQAAGYTAATSFADDSSADGAWGSLRIADAVGNVLTDWQASASFRTFADGAAGSAEYQAAIASDVRAALQRIDLPAWASDMLTALGDTPDLTTLGVSVAQITAVADALEVMGDKLVGFAAMSDTAVSALIKAAGGFEALAVSAATYYDAFYTDAEKSAYVLGDVGSQLAAFNIAMPTTRESFRALVEAQQALGNGEAVAALLKVAGAFASVVPVTETLAATVTDLGDAARDAARAMESALGSVNDEIKRLRGELVAGSPGGESYLTALFATTTAQARAGSITAMESLPEISQALEAAAALNATSSVDLARTRAWLAGSLSATAGTPPADVFGTLPTTPGNYVAAQAVGTAQLEALVQRLTTEVEGLRVEARATATHTSNTNRLIERLTPDGDALAVREAAAL